MSSIDLLIELSKLFNISIDDLLCLNDDEVKIEESNIFKGHNRKYIIDKIISNELKIDLINTFYQFSPLERIMIIKAIKEGKLKVNEFEFSKRLSESEKKIVIRKSKKVLKTPLKKEKTI